MEALWKGKTLSPFLKWPGGKKWLVDYYPGIFQVEYNRYIEPFLGGGAVFFSLAPQRSILGDINQSLIDTYKAISFHSKEIVKKLKKHHKMHSKEYFYEIRKKRYRSPISKAAQFIYLNRTCFNGLYRVNRQGEFNVPIGTKNWVLSKNDDFENVASLLKNAEIINSDFEKIISLASDGDLVFADPPYTVKHNNNNFRRYNEHLFSWNDQLRLHSSLLQAKNRGAKIILCNADNLSIKKLYTGIGKYFCFKRHSTLAANKFNRVKTTELVITNTIS